MRRKKFAATWQKTVRYCLENKNKKEYQQKVMAFFTVRLVVNFMFQNVLTLWIQFLKYFRGYNNLLEKPYMIKFIEDKSCNKKFGPHRICPKDKRKQFKKYL
jgi:hypothetical protein